MGNLNLTQMTEAQDGKATSSNDSDGELENAITDKITKTITGSNAATVTVAELRRAAVIDVQDDSSSAGITITIASAFQRGPFAVTNDTPFSVTVEISGQSGTPPVVPPSTSMLCVLNGTEVLPVSSAIGITSAGTAGTGVVATEYGDGFSRVTKLELAGVLPDIVGGAAESEGLLVYTFPAGVIMVDAVHMDVSITQTEGFINTDTPEVGVGSTLAASASATLGATEDDYVAGLVAANCTGTKTDKSEASAVLLEVSDAHTIHFNAAATWAANGDAAAILGGDVWIAWRFLGA